MSRHNGVGQQPGDVLPEAEALSAYIDDRLDPVAKAALEKRLETDITARTNLDNLHRTVSVLRAVPSQRPPRSFVLDEVTATRLRRQPQAAFADVAPIDIRTRRPVALYLRAASALVAVLLLALTAFDIAGTFSSASVPVQANVVTSVPRPTRAPATCNPDINCVQGAGTQLTLPPLPTATPAPAAHPIASPTEGFNVRLLEGLLLLVVIALVGTSFVVKSGTSRTLRPRAP